jgi:hypothetical protein
MRASRDLFAALFTLLMGLTLSCQSERIVEPSVGTLEITTATFGSEPDPDGYTVQLDVEQPRAIGPTAKLEGIELPPGNHTLLLEGLATNCSTIRDNPRTVRITAGQTIGVLFQVTCSATVGTLVITTATSGESLDPDGYGVSVNGTASGTIGANTALTINGLSGPHQVELSGVASNCHVEGENPRQVTVVPGASASITFRVVCLPAPGTKIAFVSWRSGRQDIFTMNRDGSAQRNLTPDLAHDNLPSWSPDGRKILFMSLRPGSLDILVMNADGSGQTSLKTGASIDASPWSPDGRKIAFSSDRSGNLQIGVMNADGSEPTGLTNDEFASYQPAWSPDGARLSFTRADRIFVMNADGSAQMPLSNPANSENDWEAKWSPDAVIARGRRPRSNPATGECGPRDCFGRRRALAMTRVKRP